MLGKTRCFFLLLLLLGAKPLPSGARDMEVQEVELLLSREDYSTATLGKTIFFAGGRMNGTVSDTVDIYQADRNTWSRASLSEPRYLPAMITLNKHVFIAGGCLAEGRYSRATDVYNTEEKEWARFDLSQARGHITAYAANNKVFFVGGRIGSRNSDIVDIFDVDRGTLEQAHLSQARYYPTVARINNNIILFAGGHLGRRQFSDVVDIYTLDTKQWTSTRLSQARRDLSITPIGDKVIIAAGNRDENNTQTVINIFEIFSMRKPNERSYDQRVSADNAGFLSDLENDLVEAIMNDAPILRIKERIQKQIEILTAESLEESVSKLDEVESYFWPGAMGYDVYPSGFPLDPNLGQWDVSAIMSNRRFLKVYQEVSDISKKEAEALLNKEIKETLAKYQSLLTGYMLENKWYFDSLERGKMPSTGPALQIGNNKDGSPTLIGTRLKALSLVLLAGNLRLDGTKDAVRTFAAYALEQRRQLHADPFNSRMVSADFLLNVSLCNCQILMTGILGTGLSSEEEKRLLEDMSCAKQQETLTHFDARATPYDLYSRKRGGPIPIDYSKGTVRIEYIKPVSDSTFERIVERPEIGPKT